ncbi:MAG: hypothetical protein WAT39_05150 [Planctomycetota bacterium]
MDHELLEGAACAGSDLTARLLAELVAANARLESTERRLRLAATWGLGSVKALRAQHQLCRSHVAALRQMLAGLPPFEGGCHAASA